MIESLRVENFRCFKLLELDRLRRVNIIVGKNASGKTVLLEAIKFGLDGTPNVIPWLNQMRNIFTFMPLNPTIEQFQAQFVDLFHDFDAKTPIVIQIQGSAHGSAVLRIYFDPERAVTAQPSIGFQPTLSPILSPPPSTIIPLAFDRINFKGEKSIICATINPAGQLYLEPGKGMGLTSGFISNIYFGSPPENAAWLSQLSIEKRSEEVVKSIQRHFPFIRQVTSETPAPGIGTIYADIENLPRKIPLSLLSGGISRLFALILSIIAYQKGVVLIDEIENGIFYEQYPLLWRTLIDLARHHDTQLFISTHSAECLKAAVPVVKENSSEFCLLRVNKKNAKSDVEKFFGPQLYAALEKGGEIRSSR